MRRALVATLVGAVACGLREVPGPPGEEQIVVQGVLNAQAAEQVLWIERTIPAGDPIGFEPTPLASPPTRIEVRDSAGALFSYQADTADLTRFVAAFTPTPGARYELLLEAGAHVLRASTRVPDAVTIVDPAADTIAVARDSLLRLIWAGPVRPMRVTVSDTTGRQFIGFPEWVTRGTTAELRLFSPLPAIAVWVLALDSVTARVVDPFAVGLDRAVFGQFRGNVSGGVGFFGAASSDHVIVRLQ